MVDSCLSMLCKDVKNQTRAIIILSFTAKKQDLYMIEDNITER